MIRRRILKLLLTLAGLSLFPTLLSAQPYMDSARVQCIEQAQKLLFNDRYAEVDSIYRERIGERPNDPAGYLFRAGALFAEMSDREENLSEVVFKQLLDSVETQTQRIIDTCDGPTAAWMYLFRGHAKAYRSLWEARFGSFLSALKLGLATIDEYEAGLRADSGLYDLHAGIGSYHYWKSAKAGFLSWLGIFKDEREQGIAELHLAADSSLLHREVSYSALIWIWLDCKEYDSAIAMAREFVERYPDGRTFRWPLAQAFFRQEQYEEAAAVFRPIRSRLRTSPGNYYNVIQCDYYLTQCYNWLSDADRTRLASRRLYEYYDKIPTETLRRQRAKLNFLTRIARR